MFLFLGLIVLVSVSLAAGLCPKMGLMGELQSSLCIRESLSIK